ncbi:MAG TPA: redoxin domain-containing protein [Methylomirabilota bacterium]|nr:redoxin domain-containing protein [Methylomirabilota bacterium]
MLALLLAVMALAAPAAGGDSIDALSTIELPDQHGGTDSLAAHRGRVVLVLVVTAKRLRTIRPWEEDLRQRFDELEVVRVTDVPPDSKASLDQVAEKLRERVPDGVSVLLDLERRWATALGLDTGTPNLLVIGPDGALLDAFAGRHDPELAGRVAAALARFLEVP